MKISDRTRTATKPDGTKIPVVDSKLTTIIQPTIDDIKNGVPRDPTRCMYAVTCKRLYQSELVWITRTRAYVELKNKGGRPELHRFVLADPARVNIKDFDAKKDVTPEAILFLAPKGRTTLEGQRKVQRAWEHNMRQGKAYVSGDAIPESGPKRPAKKKPVSLRESGSGKFQFQHRKSESQGLAIK